MQNEEEDDDGMRDFGQKVDLCQRIRDVLTNYPEGALLKVSNDSTPLAEPCVGGQYCSFATVRGVN